MSGLTVGDDNYRIKNVDADQSEDSSKQA